MEWYNSRVPKKRSVGPTGLAQLSEHLGASQVEDNSADLDHTEVWHQLLGILPYANSVYFSPQPKLLQPQDLQSYYLLVKSLHLRCLAESAPARVDTETTYLA